jgi:hypothetical protein
MYRKAWTQSSAVSASARLRLFSHGITYQVAINKSTMKLSVLHQSIGPNYVKVLAQPGIGSLTREVIAQVKAAVRETGRRAATIMWFSVSGRSPNSRRGEVRATKQL